MEIKNFDFSQVSAGYRLCFNAQCERCADCIRYVAGQHLPAGMDFGPAIYPNALADGQCKYFIEACDIKAAWGFAPLYTHVERYHRAPIRKDITAYLGSVGTYYRYDKGERRLNSKQQRDIMDIFAKYGYTGDLHFAHYEASYEF